MQEVDFRFPRRVKPDKRLLKRYGYRESWARVALRDVPSAERLPKHQGVLCHIGRLSQIAGVEAAEEAVSVLLANGLTGKAAVSWLRETLSGKRKRGSVARLTELIVRTIGDYKLERDISDGCIHTAIQLAWQASKSPVDNTD